MSLSRRAALKGGLGIVGIHSLAPLLSAVEADKPSGWTIEYFAGRRVFARGEGKRIVILLHELNGMSPGCVDFGAELAFRGFNVRMPLLFGHPVQDNIVLGTLESCVFGGFHCLSSARKSDTRPVLWLERYIQSLSALREVDAIGVIGMCETGAYPLATMTKDGKVRAAVLSQPALPLRHRFQEDVGLSLDTMNRARSSKIPILALRFCRDDICTHQRFEYLSSFFKDQIAIHQLEGPTGFHASCTHRLHAVLTGPFGDVRSSVRNMVIAFLEARLC